MLSELDVSPTLETVAVKLNLCEYRAGASGATTSLEFVSNLIAALEERCARLKRIVFLESDSSGTRASDLFALLGFEDFASSVSGGELFDPKQSEWENVGTVGGLPIELPRVAFEVDLLINVPKLKSHGKAGYSGALKNNFGLVRRKWKLPYHAYLRETVIASNRSLPRQLTVADGGTVLSGRGPSYGIPHTPEVMLGSWDPVAADLAGARIIGLSPLLLGHVRAAGKAGLGSTQYKLHWRDGDYGPTEKPKFDWVRFAAAAALRRS